MLKERKCNGGWHWALLCSPQTPPPGTRDYQEGELVASVIQEALPQHHHTDCFRCDREWERCPLQKGIPGSKMAGQEGDTGGHGAWEEGWGWKAPARKRGCRWSSEEQSHQGLVEWDKGDKREDGETRKNNEGKK